MLLYLYESTFVVALFYHLVFLFLFSFSHLNYTHENFSPLLDKNEGIAGGYSFELLTQLRIAGKISTKAPTSSKFRGEHWKICMEFVYLTENNSEINHWYYCKICKTFINTDLSHGTAPVSNHAMFHKHGAKLSLREQKFRQILSNATKYGATNGPREPEDFVFPTPINWDIDFLQNTAGPSNSNRSGK